LSQAYCRADGIKRDAPFSTLDMMSEYHELIVINCAGIDVASFSSLGIHHLISRRGGSIGRRISGIFASRRPRRRGERSLREAKGRERHIPSTHC
jgi:hypothetical protein